jgi:S-methylmethionine transporter
MSIVASLYFHRRKFVREGGRVADLAYRTPLYPVLPIVAFALLLVSVIAIAFDPNQVAALYFGLPFVGACYLYFWWRHGRKGRATASDHESESLGV